MIPILTTHGLSSRFLLDVFDPGLECRDVLRQFLEAPLQENAPALLVEQGRLDPLEGSGVLRGPATPQDSIVGLGKRLCLLCPVTLPPGAPADASRDAGGRRDGP